MSQFSGDRLPPPLRFDLAKPAVPGTAAQATLLATTDASGSPRIAVIAGAEIGVDGDKTLRIRLRTDHATCANLLDRRVASLWCVLDGAAYTIQLTAAPAGPAADGMQPFTLSVTGVWCDFRAESPMLGGPTYRTSETD